MISQIMNCMNCGVACIRRYLELNGYESYSLLAMIDRKCVGDGLSVSDLMDVMQSYGFSVRAYHSLKPVYAPEIIMLNVRKRHYCLVESCDRKHIYLYDPNIGTVPVKRVLWRFLWSNYYITLCYNVNDQRRHLWP